MKKELANYNIDIEEKWQKYWSESNIYNWDEEISREDSFVIDTPPPTVSGSLHMGHIFSYTQADFIARYQRMIGKNVFYPMGFDDNGLPTERLVEKVKNIRANDMTREEFIKICMEVVKDSEEDFRQLFKSIALSVDWNLEYQTISEHSRKLSQLSFLELLNQDKSYRKLQPTLWDPVDQTALAQADIVDKEQKGIMNEIIFKTESGDTITIATTRPELIPACVAIFFNPEDTRYKHFEGQYAITPFFGAKVKIIADNAVNIEKGTGLVMCCTFGDTTDVDWWKKHFLDLKIIIDKSGRLCDLDKHVVANEYTKALTGLKIKEARAKMIEFLKTQNLIKAQNEVDQVIKCAERSGAPLEILVNPQWFIKLLDSKEDLLAKADECNWHPSYMKIRLENWIKNLSWDWCISRQRFFGVPFPVWYSKRIGEEGKILLPELDQLPIDPFVDLPSGYSRDEIEPDPDVMDTWATSSISPQLSSQAINKDYNIDYERHSKLFPADLRPQAHEIIRTWAFYTIVKALYHENTIPWRNLMISGWCLASDKTKMSKSKGNVVTPQKLIEQYGADIIRYWTSTSKLGADTAYSNDVILVGKKLINKLWNASKFVATHIKDLGNKDSKDIYHPIDLWAISKLAKVIKLAGEEFGKFEYCNVRVIIEDYFWNIFCDNYLEIIKVRIYDKDNLNPRAKLSAANALYIILESLLKLLAPFVPHITEEIYNSLYSENSIHTKGNWPDYNLFEQDKSSEEEGDYLVQILNEVRKFKGEKQISPKTSLSELKIYSDIKLNPEVINDLKNVTNANEINQLPKRDKDDENILVTDEDKFKIEIKL